jgi:hypothetical protein
MLIGMLGSFFLEVVNAGASIALFALGYQIGEFVGVAGRFPDHRVHKDTAVEPDNIIAHLYDAFPPGLFDVVLQFDSERPVVVTARKAAIDFTGLKYKTPSLTQRYNFIKPGNLCHIKSPKLSIGLII